MKVRVQAYASKRHDRPFKTKTFADSTSEKFNVFLSDLLYEIANGSVSTIIIQSMEASA